MIGFIFIVLFVLDKFIFVIMFIILFMKLSFLNESDILNCCFFKIFWSVWGSILFRKDVKLKVY